MTLLPRTKALLICWGVATSLPLLTPARAESVSAQVLFDKGRVLMQEGKYAEACAALAESAKVEPEGGTLLNLAVCRELEGKPATALQDYRSALAQAQADQRADRIQMATERIENLSASVPRVAFEVHQKDPVPQLQIGPVDVPSAQWTVGRELDPGRYDIRASAPGFRPWSTTIVVPSSMQQPIVIVVPTLERVTPPVAVPPPPRVLIKPPTLVTVPPSSTYESWRQAMNLTSIVGLAVGVVAGVQSVIDNSQASDQCIEERNFCTPEGQENAKNAKTWAWVSTIGFGVAATGFTVTLVLPRDRPTYRYVPSAQLHLGGVLPF